MQSIVCCRFVVEQLNTIQLILYVCGLYDSTDWLKILSSINLQKSNTIIYENKIFGPHLLNYGEILFYILTHMQICHLKHMLEEHAKDCWQSNHLARATNFTF